MIELDIAKLIATDFIDRYGQHCQKIEIAGSIRREKPEVKDIEIVALPTWGKNLFGDPVYTYNPLIGAVAKDNHEFVKYGSKYAQFYYASAVVDLFCCTEGNWAWNYLIRTGSREFSHALMSRLNRMGYTLKGSWPHTIIGYDDNLKAIAGEPYPIAMATEQDVFDFLGLQYVEPTDRIDGSAVKLLPESEVSNV